MALWLSEECMFETNKAADVNESHPMKWMASWQFLLHRCIWSSSNENNEPKSHLKMHIWDWLRLYMSIIEATIFSKVYKSTNSVSFCLRCCLYHVFFQLPWHTSCFCFLSLRSLSTAKKSWAPRDRVSGFKKRGIDGTSDLKLMAGWREDFMNASCLCIFFMVHLWMVHFGSYDSFMGSGRIIHRWCQHLDIIG